MTQIHSTIPKKCRTSTESDLIWGIVLKSQEDTRIRDLLTQIKSSTKSAKPKANRSNPSPDRSSDSHRTSFARAATVTSLVRTTAATAIGSAKPGSQHSISLTKTLKKIKIYDLINKLEGKLVDRDLIVTWSEGGGRRWS